MAQTVPVYQLQSINYKQVQGTNVELNIPVVDANGLPIDITSGSAPGPYTTVLTVDLAYEDVNFTAFTNAGTPGVGQWTMNHSMILPQGTYNAMLKITGVDSQPHPLALGTITVVQGV